MKTKKVSNRRLVLSLYIAGKTIKSMAAYKNLKFICDDVLKGMYTLKVIDILKNPKLARKNQIFAIPTLIRSFPLPQKNIIGDLSDRKLVIAGLDYRINV